jgi:DNA-binding transcriptional MerR regulator
MLQGLPITALAKQTGVRSTTLRYWERLGLLPSAARTHTGYRLFGNDALRYVEFVRKSKEMGLSLREMKRVLELARKGQSPCPEVERLVEQKLECSKGRFGPFASFNGGFVVSAKIATKPMLRKRGRKSFAA